jgi:LUD domain
MNTTKTPDRFAALPDEDTLAATVTALEEHGFSVEVVDDLDAAREAVLARIPHGSSVMTNTSVTLQEAGITDAVNDSGHYDSARARMEAARDRVYSHSLVLEDGRAVAAYGQHSYVGKILEIHAELPGRIHIVLVRQPAGF